MVRALHKQYPRQIVKKDNAYPLRHAVSPWGTEIPVDDDDCNEYGEDVHDKSEEKIFSYEWDGDGCGG